MKPWILYACLTVVAWGVWGVFSKLASNYGRPRQTLLFQVAGVMAFGFIVIAMSSLYPVVTIVLSILFLHEKISLREALGIGCALLAGFLLAG